MLAFDSAADFADLCACFDLDINEAGEVVFEPGKPPQTESTAPSTWSTRWILRKMDRPLGEMVQGGPLPRLRVIVPHDSFADASAPASMEEEEAEEELGAEPQPAAEAAPSLVPELPRPAALAIPSTLSAGRGPTAEEQKAQLEEYKKQQAADARARARGAAMAAERDALVGDVLTTKVRAVCEDAKQEHDQVAAAMEGIVKDAVAAETRQQLSALRHEAQEQVRAQQRQQRQRLSHQVVDDLVVDVVAPEAQAVARRVLQYRAMARQVLEALALEVFQQLARQTYAELLQELREDALIERWRLARTLRTWRVRLRDRRAAQSFPACQTMQPIQAVVERFRAKRPRLSRSPSSGTPPASRLGLLSPAEVDVSRKQVSEHLQLQRDQLPRLRAVWDPIPSLLECVADKLSRPSDSPVRLWKLVASAAVPQADFAVWLRCKLGLHQQPVSIDAAVDGMWHTCARWLESPADDAEAMRACSALLFALPVVAEATVSGSSVHYWTDASSRLAQLVHMLPRGTPVLVLHNWFAEAMPAEVDEYLRLHELGAATGCNVVVVSTYAASLPPDVLPGEFASHLLHNSLRWLAAETRPAATEPEANFVHFSELVDALWQVQLAQHAGPGGLYDDSSLPAHIVDRFNQCLLRAVELARANEAQLPPWLPPELADVSALAVRQLLPVAQLQSLLQRFELPPLPPALQDEAALDAQHAECLSYIDRLVSLHGLALAPLLSAAKSVVFNAEYAGQPVPWAKVFELVIHYFLGAMAGTPGLIAAYDMAQVHEPLTGQAPASSARRKRKTMSTPSSPGILKKKKEEEEEGKKKKKKWKSMRDGKGRDFVL